MVNGGSGHRQRRHALPNVAPAFSGATRGQAQSGHQKVVTAEPAHASAARSAPEPLSPAVRDKLRAQRRRDTKPELALRRELHRRGLRYQVDRPPLAGIRRRADVVFTRARVAVFVDGCFWHRCPAHGTAPRNNAKWWADKLDGNVRRDRDTDLRLAVAGWDVVRVWEHETPASAADRVIEAVRARQDLPR